MWVKFWHESRCSAGASDRDETYEWVNDEETDEGLKDYAAELVPPWRREDDYGYRYGFERVAELPFNVREGLIKRFTQMKMLAESMLEQLRT